MIVDCEPDPQKLTTRERVLVTLRPWGRFALTGGLATVTSYGVFVALLQVVSHLPAYSAAYFFGLVFGYVVNSMWTFGGKQPRTLRQFVAYTLVHAVVLSVSAVVLEIEVSAFGIPPELAAIPNTGINATLGFFLLRRFVFRST